MNRNNPYRFYLGWLLILIITLMNVYLAVSYYRLDQIKITQFFVWQTNVTK